MLFLSQAADAACGGFWVVTTPAKSSHPASMRRAVKALKMATTLAKLLSGEITYTDLLDASVSMHFASDCLFKYWFVLVVATKESCLDEFACKVRWISRRVSARVHCFLCLFEHS